MAKVIRADLGATSRVAQHVDIQRVDLIKVQAELNVVVEDLVEMSNVRFLDQHSCGFERFSNEWQEVSFVAKFGGRAVVKEDGHTNELLFVRSEFRAVYTLTTEERFDDGDLAEFANSNVVYNCWPYWRELLASTLMRFGAPPFILPSLAVRGRSVDSGEES